jgi:hypothetical protein
MAKGLGTRFTRIDSAVFAHGIIRTQGAILVLISGAIGDLKKDIISMVIGVVKFSSGGIQNQKGFCLKISIPKGN